MADTLDNIALEKGVWVDLYDGSGLTIGTDQLEVQNLGNSLIYLYAGATAPTDKPGNAYNVLPQFQTAQNSTDDAGAWALCLNTDGLINVKAV